MTETLTEWVERLDRDKKVWLCADCREEMVSIFSDPPANRLCHNCREKEAYKSLTYKSEDRVRWWQNTLTELHVPTRFREVQANCKLPPTIKKWRGNPWALTILGPVGVGKTWAATWAFARCYADMPELEECDTAWVRLRDLATAAYDQMRQSGDSGYLARLAMKRLVLIDDLGAEVKADMVQAAVVSLIDERWAAKRPTIVTSNAESVEQLGSLTDDRIASRLHDGWIVPLIGEDRRGARA